jgi:hypothetical protein
MAKRKETCLWCNKRKPVAPHGACKRCNDIDDDFMEIRCRAVKAGIPEELLIQFGEDLCDIQQRAFKAGCLDALDTMLESRPSNLACGVDRFLVLRAAQGDLKATKAIVAMTER